MDVVSSKTLKWTFSKAVPAFLLENHDGPVRPNTAHSGWLRLKVFSLNQPDCPVLGQC